MNDLLGHRTFLRSGWHCLVWLAWITPVAVISGSATALFLWGLDAVTHARFAHPDLLYLLPVVGPLIPWVYRRFGKNADQGTNLILDEIHQPGGGVPARMAPLVLVTTWLTHLFGGSAGREGTAVQMGGSLADGWVRWCRPARKHRRILLLGGVASGFGAVFGTPLAGAVFAMEVLAIGTLEYDALIPCLFAGVLGDAVCTAWGIHHTHYTISTVIPGLDAGWGWGLFLGQVVVMGLCSGWVSRLFVEISHALQRFWKRRVVIAWLRPVLGGFLVIGFTAMLGTRSYLGLGVEPSSPGDITLVSAFQSDGATPWSWFWKLLLTAITLSSGFKGGEVTPLFFIGATLGNALSHPLRAATDLCAGLGFVSVFAGASNTPLACTLMGIELFGGAYAMPMALSCYLAWLASGHAGIYGAQRLRHAKHPGSTSPTGQALRDLRPGS